MKLHELIADEVTIPVTYRDHEVKVTYRPSALTPAMLAGLNGKTPTDATIGTLVSMLVSWDLYGDDGVTMVPIDADTLSTLPQKLLGAIDEAMWADLNQGEASPPLGGS